MAKPPLASRASHFADGAMAMLFALALAIQVSAQESAPQSPAAPKKFVAKEAPAKAATKSAENTKKDDKQKDARSTLENWFPFLRPRPATPAPPPKTGPTALISDPQTIRKLPESKRLIAEKQTASAFALLHSVFLEPEDSFVRDGDDDWITAREQAERIVLDLGNEGLALYRGHYGDEAADLLRRAIAAGDEQRVADVVRHYFLTQAGFQASNWLAGHQLDRGQAGIALAYLDRLIESKAHRSNVTPTMRAKRAVALAVLGKSNEAAGTISGLAERTLRLAGRDFDSADLLKQLGPQPPAGARVEDRWLVFGGNLQRSGRSDGGVPLLRPTWRIPFTSEKAVESLLDDALDSISDLNQGLVIEFAPILDGNTLFYRSFQGTKAVDLSGGATIWTYQGGATIDDYLKRDPDAALASISAGQNIGRRFMFLMNSVYGMLSADTERVYEVDQYVFNPNMYVPATINRKPNPEYTSRNQNQLTALDRATGKVVWTTGGTSSQPADPQTAETFFLGPPLPIGERLYVLGESRSEIRLYELDAATGTTLWKQALLMTEQPIGADIFRRSQACHLAYVDGVLVCPTNLDRIVAIDPLTRSRLWEFTYTIDRQPRFRAAQPFPVNTGSYSMSYATEAPVIADGKIYLNTARGRRLFCLDLLSGEELWKSDRTTETTWGGVFGQTIVVFSNNEARGLNSANGATKWTLPITPPSGRPACLQSTLLLPLASGGIAHIDPERGAVLQMISNRASDPLGNLVAGRRQIIACGLNGLASFPLRSDVESESSRLLSERADDPKGLRLRADLRLTSGAPFDAMDDLRRAASTEPTGLASTAARELLFDIAAREAIADPTKATPFLDDLNRLAATALEQSVVCRLEAEERLAKRDLAGAWNAVLRHMTIGSSAPIEDASGVARSPMAWSRNLANRLIAAANTDETRRALFDEMKKTVATVAAGEDEKAIALLAGVLNEQEIAEPVARAEAESLMRQSRWGAAELGLLAASQGAAPSLAATSSRLLAKLLESRGYKGEAVGIASQLAARFPNAVVEGNLTAREWHEDLIRKAPKEPVTHIKWIEEAIVGKVFKESRNQGFPTLFTAAEPEETRFGDMLLSLNASRWKMEFSDRSTGRPLWSSELPRVRTRSINQRGNYYHEVGHLILLMHSNTIFALSALDQRVIWNYPLTSGGEATAYVRVPNSGPQQLSSPIVAAGAGFVAVRDGRDLVVLDPRDGSLLWSRRRVPPNVYIFGDREVLFCTAHDGTGEVHRTTDGQVLRTLGSSAIGASNAAFRQAFVNRREIFGRQLLLTHTEGSNFVVRLWDPWTGSDIWAKRYAQGTRHFFGQDRLLVIVDPSTQKMELLDRKTGAALLTDAWGAAVPTISSVYAFRDADRLLLLIDKHAVVRNSGTFFSMPVYMMPNISSRPVNGSIRSYNAKSLKLEWEKDAVGRSVITNPGAELPVLFTFGSELASVGGNKQWRTSIELVSKRDGQTVFREIVDDFPSFNELVSSAKEQWAELRTWNMRVRIDFLTAAQAAERKAKAERPSLFDTIGRIGKSLKTEPEPKIMPAEKKAVKQQ